MFILQPSLKDDALRREVEGALGISFPHPFPGSGTKVWRTHFQVPVAREGAEAGQEPRGFPLARESPCLSVP